MSETMIFDVKLFKSQLTTPSKVVTCECHIQTNVIFYLKNNIMLNRIINTVTIHNMFK